MKKKTKTKLIIWASVILFLIIAGFAGYKFALNYAGSRAMNSIISNQLEEMVDSGEITLDEVAQIAQPEELPLEEKEETTHEETAIVSPEKESTSSEVQKPAPSTPATKKETIKKASQKIEEQIPRSEKEEMMKLISARLTADDVKQLMALLSGGLTHGEPGKAAKIAYARFTPEEITKIKSFWHKYKAMVLKK